MFIFNHLLHNVIKNIYWYSNIKECFNLAYTNKHNWDIFCKTNHTKIYQIHKSYYYIINKWKNIKFNVEISKIKNVDLELYKNVYNLLLYKSTVIDISLLKDINGIILFNCYNIINISSLFNLNYIYIIDSWIYDLSNFGTQNEIYLYNCKYIRDISSLSKINRLTLIKCHNIKDISMLRVKKLIIKKCKRINKNQIIELKKYIKDITYVD